MSKNVSLKASADGKGKARRSAAVEDLIDSIVKKKGFKQLASYSVKCLQMLLQTSRIGWEIQARAAYELGGTRAVLDVLNKYPTDAELLKFGLSSLRSMLTIPSTIPVDKDSVGLSVELLKALVEPNGAASSLPEADRTSLTAEALEFNLLVARRSPGSLPEEQLFRILATVCSRMATVPKNMSANDAAGKVALAGTVFRLIFALTTSREGLNTIINDTAFLNKLLLSLQAVYDAGLSAIAGNSNVIATNTKGRNTGNDTPMVNTINGVKAAMDPCIRVFDRMSRVPEGTYVLATANAGSNLMPIADWWINTADEEAEKAAAANSNAGTSSSSSSSASGNETTNASVLSPAAMLDLINRLAGDTIEEMLTAMMALSDTAIGKQQGARLLAKICDLPERATALARDKVQAVRVVDLLQTSIDMFAELAEADAAMDLDAGAAELSSSIAFLQLLCRVAERPSTSVSNSGLQTVLDAGALWACLTALESVGSATSNISQLNVLHTALGASALRFLSYTLGSVPDAETSYYGNAIETIGDEQNRTAVETIVDNEKFLPALTSLLYAPVDAAVDSSNFLAQLARLTYAAATARELFLLAIGGDSIVSKAIGIDVKNNKLNSTGKQLLAALGTAIDTSGKVFANLLGINPSTVTIVDRNYWAWMPAAAADIITETAVAATATEDAAAALVENGGLAGLVCMLTGKSSVSATTGTTVGTKKGLVRQASGIQIAGRTQSYSWVRALLREQPSWFVYGGFANAPRLAADTLTLSASLITFLVPHATADKGENDEFIAPTALSPSALSAVKVLTPETPSDVSTAVLVRAGIDALLEACLFTYAAHPSDTDVYAAFKEVVDVAGVSAEELIGAVDGLRGITVALRAALTDPKLVTSAVRSSAITTSGTNIAGALKSVDNLIEGSAIHALETDPDDKKIQQTIKDSLAEVRMKVPKDTALILQLYQLLGYARERLLLLEAVSLSPILSWALTYMNGIYPLLSLISCIIGIATLHPDLTDGAATGGATCAKLAERIDDVMSHAFVVLSNLARVGYEVVQTGSYALEVAVPVLPSLDRRMVAEQIFSSYVTGVVCTSVNSLMASGLKLPSFISSAVPLTGWLAAALNVTWAKGEEPNWKNKYLDQLLSAEFIEASVAMLRQGMAYAGANDPSKKALVTSSNLQNASSGLTGVSAAAANRITYDVVATTIANLQHIAVRKPGANAVATRGASRQLMRSIPALTHMCGSNTSHPAYRALLSLLNVLNVCVTVGNADNNTASNANDNEEGNLSVSRLLYKQGLVDAMLQVVFSGVGFGAGGMDGSGNVTEACQVALAIVSAVSAKKDVIDAVKRLYDVCGKTSAAIAAYMDAATVEAESWNAIAALGNGAKTAPSSKHAVLTIDGIENNANTAENNDEEENSSNLSALNSALLAALQVFGLLITTEAGQRVGTDTTAQGMAACASLVQCAVNYLVMIGRVHESVLAAVASVTASTDDKAPTPLPAPISQAANLALSAPAKTERDLLWCIPTACQVMRVSLGVLRTMTDADAAATSTGAANSDTATDNLSVAAMSKDGILSNSLVTVVNTAIDTVETSINQPVLQSLSQAAAGVNLLGSAGGGKGKISTGAEKGTSNSSGSIPTVRTLLLESTSTLASLSNSLVCARSVPESAENTGIDIVLSIIAAAHDKALTGDSVAGNASGSNNASGSGSNNSSGESNSQDIGLAVECNALAVLDAVAASSPEALVELTQKGCVEKIMGVLGEVVQAAVASTGKVASGSKNVSNDSSSIAGVAHAISALARLATNGKNVTNMLGSGIVSFLKSAAVLLPEEGRPNVSGASPKIIALLTRSMAILLTRLSTVGYCLNGEENDESPDISGETQHSATLRELTVRVCVAVASSPACAESPMTVLAVVQLILDYAVASEIVPASSAERSLTLLRTSVAATLVPVIKKAMTAGNAPLELLPLGRKVIALLTPRAVVVETPVADKTDGSNVVTAATSPVPVQVDELAELVSEVYTKVDDLQIIFAQYIDTVSSVIKPPTDDAENISETDPLEKRIQFKSAPELMEMAEKQAETLLESIRSLSLLLGPRFPISIADDGATELSEKAKADALAVRESLESTSATEWSIYATLKACITGLSTWLCTHGDENFKPTRKITSLSYDVITTTSPLVARISAWAEDSRQRTLEAYYAGSVTEWELPSENDVPLSDALGTVCHAIESHINPVEALLLGGRAAATSSGAHYNPSGPAIDAVCRCVRVMVSASGKDAIGSLAQTGTISHFLRLMNTLRRLKDEATNGSLTGDGGRERGRAIATECERAATSIMTTIKAVLSKAESEVNLYCVPQRKGDTDVREVTSVVSAPAMADLMRAAASLALLTSESMEEDEDDNEDDEDENTDNATPKIKDDNKVKINAVDTQIESQARTLVKSEGGVEATWNVLDSLATSTLSAITGIGTDKGVGESAADPRANLKIFSNLLTALVEHMDGDVQAAANTGKSSNASSSSTDKPLIEATLPVVRTLYATIATCLQILAGDTYTEAFQAATGESLNRDAAIDEFVDVSTKFDTDVNLWTVPTTLVAVATSSAEDAEVEEI